MKITLKTMIVALVFAIIAINAPAGPATASLLSPGNLTPKYNQKTSPPATLNAVCIIQLAQNTETAITPEIAVENCCIDKEKCEVEIEELKLEVERLKNDPPEIPVKSWLMSLPWFRNLDPTLQTMIGGVGSLLIIGVITYLGSLSN